MKQFRNRLTLIMLVLIGLSMLGAGLAMVKVFKQSHIQLLEDNMIREIRLLQTMMDFPDTDSPDAVEYYTNRSLQLEELSDARVTFITKDGRVIGDSESNPVTMDNHAYREEVLEAEKTGKGSTIRRSSTLGQDMLYVALPVKVGDSFDGFVRLSLSLSQVDQGVRQGWTVMGIGLAILFLAASLLSIRVAKGLTSPLEKITRVARRIARLEYDARVNINRKDEIGQLAQAINGMADSLQTQVRTIRDNEDLLQSVLNNMTGGIVMVNGSGHIMLINRAAERMLGVDAEVITGKSYRELKQHYELTKLMKEGLENRNSFHEERNLYYPVESIVRLDGVPMVQEDGAYRGMLFLLQDVSDIRRLERMRSEFVANVSHELKTPLAAVKGFAETLLGGGVSDEKTARSFLQIIYDESERLNRLIGDILELSSIESKRVQMDYSPIHLQAFFETISEMMRTVAEKKRISLELDVPEELFMEGDEDKLRQIFMNLLSNAINYTQEGGRVKLTAREKLHNGQSEDIVQFIVKDSGIGIPKKDLPRIFERFYRVDKARSRGSGGTGLGLSIVKHLVDMHHGRIDVESELGVGSSFIIELPVLQEHEEAGI
ncbi:MULTISPECIES: ATP-binding protein [Paenibacillus]|jgi:two-component system phosphate regulon sensor histidine kinase PhoR|uniref:histidine kinase n=2 Tax=Paenibacillus lactis TaxID=228574 RepID=G4H8C6_9BACL|nr:ATP-binding protein [Paenibacillus lactis]EHB68111.1 multi-sensor signal transduction histidine kinase [Paenibacillus lactis 154]MBP1892138.1 two-component system phosphate regulon sensor histidine kinase PhoR [Paenibacillus lactis]MCM3492823.1 cell wall metabolism sensor histidine kinase WalK [Paenibacillus lactis]GIO89591.1 PAS domain-containing sensor histidine kinase [Paenibacillus lactis]HAF98969.1 PAS domain-containing sensor histidine kinase [Paenibacillus lactis]